MIRRIAARASAEEGFSLIEAVVAMLVAAIAFTSLAYGFVGSLRAVRDARLYQQATSLGAEQVENARDLPFDDLVHTNGDLAGDPRVLAGNRFDPDGSGPLASELLVTAASGGAVTPHITQATFGNTVFTVSRYVTWVDDAVQGGPLQSYKRIVTFVEWPVGAQTRAYRTSSFVALARRGLPIPKFELSPTVQHAEVEPGNVVVFPHTVRNLGIVDSYDIELPPPGGRNWVITFYEDVDQDSLFTPGVDTLLTDTNGTGKPDTGNVATDATFYFLAVWVLSPTETPGTVEMTLTATSGANSAVFRTSKDTLKVGTVGLTLNLHNRPSPPAGDTTSQLDMAMDLTPIAGTTLYTYSTNYYSARPGRHVEKKNISDAEYDPKFMANWVYQVPQTATFNGTAEVKIWVAVKDFACDKVLQIRAHIRKKTVSTGGAGTSLGSGDAVVSPTGLSECGFQLITINVPIVNQSVATNNWVELKLSVRNASGDNGLFAYDTTTYRSTLKLPQVSS